MAAPRSRRALWLAALLAATTATAGDLPADGTPPPEDPGERPFIEASRVLAPRQVGAWRLVQARDFEGRPDAGVGLRYEHADHPDVRVDLFVYPAGRVDAATELDRGIADVRGDIETGVTSGNYARADFDAPVDFPIPRPSPDPAPPGRDPGATALEAALAAERAGWTTIPGRKFRVVLEWSLAEVESRAYLFYRGLFLYKGRISASRVTMPGEALDALADEAMATLVPAIRVDSTGGCHAQTVVHDPASGAEALAVALAHAQRRAQEERCGPALDEAVPEGHHVLRLDFPASLWGR